MKCYFPQNPPFSKPSWAKEQLTSAAVAARTRQTRLHSNSDNEKSVRIKKIEEEEEAVGKEDKMLSRVAFRAGESVLRLRNLEVNSPS